MIRKRYYVLKNILFEQKYNIVPISFREHRVSDRAVRKVLWFVLLPQSLTERKRKLKRAVDEKRPQRKIMIH